MDYALDTVVLVYVPLLWMEYFLSHYYCVVLYRLEGRSDDDGDEEWGAWEAALAELNCWQGVTVALQVCTSSPLY